MVMESRCFLYRGHCVAFWWCPAGWTDDTDPQDSWSPFRLVWDGPPEWREELTIALKQWSRRRGYAGIDVVEYLEKLGIGRNGNTQT